MTVKKMLATLDSSEVTEWMAFYEIRAEEQRAEAARARAGG